MNVRRKFVSNRKKKRDLSVKSLSVRRRSDLKKNASSRNVLSVNAWNRKKGNASNESVSSVNVLRKRSGRGKNGLARLNWRMHAFSARSKQGACYGGSLMSSHFKRIS